MRERERQQAAAGEREHPGAHHAAGKAPFHVAQALLGAHAHDGGGLRVRGGHRQARERGQPDAEAGGKAGGEALVLLHLHHVHAYGLDDLLAAHGRAERHHGRHHDDEPERERHVAPRLAAHGQHDAQHAQRQELLAVLRAMQHGHAGAGHDLRPLEERVRLLTVHMSAQPPDELVVEPAQTEAEQRREQNAVSLFSKRQVLP